MARHKSIGFISPVIGDSHFWTLYRGISQTLRRHDANLLCLGNASLDPLFRADHQFQEPKRQILRLASQANIDGLLFMNNICPGDDPEMLARFLSQCEVPAVSIGLVEQPVSMVFFEDKTAMAQLTRHLIQKHGVRTFGFIRGPKSHPDAEIRWSAFNEVLSQHSIPLRASNVAIGDFNWPSGFAAARQILENAAGPIEAIVCANDKMAVGAIAVLRQKGIRVPHDMIVTGVDGSPEAYCSLPRLTTIAHPLEEIGCRAAELIMGRLEGTASATVILPSRLVLGESCGCASPVNFLRDPFSASAKADDNGKSDIGSLRGALRKSFTPVHRTEDAAPAESSGKLLDRLLDACTSGSADMFLEALDEVLRETIREDRDPLVWRDVLASLGQNSALRQRGERGFPLRQAIIEGQLVVENLANRATIKDSYDASNVQYAIHEFYQKTSHAGNLADLLRNIESLLPALPLFKCFLVLYDQPNHPSSSCRLVLAFDKKRAASSDRAGPREFLSVNAFLKSDLLLDVQPYELVAQELSQWGTSFGVLFIEPDFDAPVAFIGYFISSAISNMHQIQTLEKQASALAVANKQLVFLRAEEQEYLQAVKRELQVARQIQSDFLPSVLPHIDGWEMDVHFQPAQEVAGDFYDVFLLPSGRFAIVIADVCGKSIGAAIFMALVRSLVRALSQQSGASDIVETTTFLNDYVTINHSQKGPPMFVTLCLAVVDCLTGAISYVNAGHYPPVLIHRDGSFSPLETTGIAIGLKNKTSYSVGRAQIGIDDLLFAYTDGVIDVENEEGIFWGKTGLYNILRQSHATVHSLISNVRAGIESHAQGKAPGDDVTMYALRRVKMDSLGLQ